MAEASTRCAWTEDESLLEAKRAWMEELEDEFECALMDESEDEVVPDSINEDSFSPFGYGDAWALSLF
jgi:hypothetical protein